MICAGEDGAFQMMKIKFRVWDTVNKEMMYQPLADLEDLYIGLIDGGIYYHTIAMHGTENRYELLQFTGLFDSDGMEIYEGDILELLIERYEIVGGCFDDRDQVYNETNEVRFENGCFKAGEWLFDDIVGDSRGDGCDFILSAKVIGNKFESPELLGIKNG